MQVVENGEYVTTTQTVTDNLGQTSEVKVPVMETVDEAEPLRGLSLGAGFSSPFSGFILNIDYAYRHVGLLGDWQFVSLSLNF